MANQPRTTQQYANYQRNPQYKYTGTRSGAPRTLVRQTYIEEVISVLRKSHPDLVTEVERMIEAFSRKFKPEPEEELLGAIHALISKFIKHSSGSNDEVPKQLTDVIERVCRKFFSPVTQGHKQHDSFFKQYEAAFRKDFSPKGDNFPKTFGLLLQKLKKWKSKLQYKVGSKNKTNLKLECLSPYLVRFKSYDIEVPGQYLSDEKPSVDRHVTIDCFEPDVLVVKTYGYFHRRIGIKGSNGKAYYFLIQYSFSHMTRSDERMMHLYVILNMMLNKFHQSRKRNIGFHVPLVVPLNNRLRLMQTDAHRISFGEVYEHACVTTGIDPYIPCLKYKDDVREFTRTTEEKDPKKLQELRKVKKLQAYREITKTVPDTMLKSFVENSLDSLDELWAFKREFAVQYALVNYIGYIMNIGERDLYKFAFSRRSGKVINSDLYPGYNQRNVHESADIVPFRLTRNITKFLTRFMVDGIFASTIHATNMCLHRNQEILKNYLLLFTRDDLLSWSVSSKGVRIDEKQLKAYEIKIRDRMLRIVTLIIARIRQLHSSGSQKPVNTRVHNLIKDAMDENNISRMNPYLFPFF